MTKKQVLRSILFAGILMIVFWILCEIFEFQDLQRTSRYRNYRNLTENTVDAVMVGTSGMDRYWIGPKAFEEQGIIMYPLSCDQQPSWLLKHVLEEAKQSQDFQLAVIDMRPFTAGYAEGTDKYETSSRRVLDELSYFSLNRLDAARTTVEVLKMQQPEKDHDVLSYYFSFAKYHTRWEENSFRFDPDDEKFDPYLGFFIRDTVSTAGMDYFEKTVETDVRGELNPASEKALYDLLEYLKKQDYEVLFLDTPHYLTQDEYQKMNTIRDVLDEYGFNYKIYDAEDGTFNLYSEFYNDGHVNYYGAEKFTEMFAQYLKENYEFPDRREDSACVEEWSGAYDAIKERMETLSRYKLMKRPQLSAESKEDGVQLRWEVQKGVKGYDIFRNTGEGGRYELLKTVKKKKAGKFKDTKVQDGQTYYYMIRAYKEVDGEKVYSRYSETVSAAAGIR